MVSNAIESLSRFALGLNEFQGFGIERLSETYDWPVPEVEVREKFGLTLPGSSAFEKTLQMKHGLFNLWRDQPNLRFDLCKWIIRDWGGIRSNSPQTLQKHFINVTSADPDLKFEGVSSYSKALALRCPAQFAIFDARVVVALNAVQVLAKVRDGLAFPYIAGRNRVTGDRVNRRGFAYDQRFSPRSLSQERGWEIVRRGSAYRTYLDLLEEVVNCSPAAPDLMLLEMSLFSQVEELVQLVVQQEGNSAAFSARPDKGSDG